MLYPCARLQATSKSVGISLALVIIVCVQANALMDGTAEGQKAAILPQVLEAVNAKLQAEGIATGAPAAGGGSNVLGTL